MKAILFNIHDVMQFITIYQCLLFALFLWLFRSKKRGNSLLALFLLACAAMPIDNLIFYGTAFRQWAINVSPNIFYVFSHAFWLEAPLFLIYVRAMVYKDYSVKGRQWLLFMPFVAYAIYEMVHYYSLDYATKMAILQGYDTFKTPRFTLLLDVARDVFRFSCTLVALLEVRRYHSRLKDEFADIEKLSMYWLKLLVIGFLIVKADDLCERFAVISSLELHYYIDFDTIGLAGDYAVMLLISALIFFSMSSSRVFAGLPEQDPAEDDKVDNKPDINPEQITRLEQYMKDKKPYLNRLLNLDNLSAQMHMPPRTLSNLINRHYEQNFFDFINTYRVEECRRLLSDPANKNKTMLETMENAGFNSKATFNTFFKKKVGMTPSEFREQLESSTA